MKHLRNFNEDKQISSSIQVLKQHLTKSKKSEAEEHFLKAYKYNSCSVPDEFESMASEFYVYDDYYLYDNNIYKFRRDGYHTAEIKLSKMKPSELIKNLEEKLDKIEKAIEKLAYGHDV